MILLTPQNFSDYELIDSGGFQKLERFGKYVIARPEPQAVWDKALSESEWEKRANAFFKKEKSARTENSDGNEKGEWVLKKDMPGQWYISYGFKEMQLKMRLGLTSFKHVGVFPEQSENWDYIYLATKLMC
jgi:23S rRNA (cytosine1962-C5)-methyltransferase